jgi:hypothetical protein
VATCNEYRDEVSACIEVRNVFDHTRKASDIIHLGLAQGLRLISAPQ